jgi:putative metallohydrolase (TIGR04338 family)
MGKALGAHQASLYVAEAETLDGRGRRWHRRAEVQAYVDTLIASAWFTERWPDLLRCTIERRGSGSVWSTCDRLDASGPGGAATEGVILLADGCLTQPVVLHELAHLLLPPHVGHGPVFAETLMTLVRHEMGFFAFADYYYALRARPGFGSIREGIDRE